MYYDEEAEIANADSFPTARSSSSASPESVKCIVRVRPPLIEHLNSGLGESIQVIDNFSLSAANSDGSKVFQCSFDAILGPNSTQEDVYTQVSSCTESVLDGFNATVFAYGQTGSGKTHTVFQQKSIPFHSILSSL